VYAACALSGAKNGLTDRNVNATAITVRMNFVYASPFNIDFITCDNSRRRMFTIQNAVGVEAKIFP
jgi:hypothetical protein